MAFALVQSGVTVTGTNNVVLTLPVASTAGTLLVAYLANGAANAFTGPAGWMVADNLLNAAVLYYPNNPGGITTATFTATGSCRGTMTEFSTAAGMVQVLDKTGRGSSNPPATSFPVTATGSSAAGDLGVAAYADIFSPATTGQTWTQPTGYTTLRTTANQPTSYNASYKLSLSSGTQTVTASYSSSTGQTSWAGVFAAFTETAASGLSVTTAALPDGKIGVAYQQTLTAAGGTPPYSWAISAGALPAGLSLISSGGRGGGFGITFARGTLNIDGRSMETARADWMALVGRTVTCSKWYAPAGQFPTNLDTVIQGCINQGMTAYLCYKPAFNPPTQADYNALQHSLQTFKDAGLTAKVVLYQEIEEQAPTPAQYKAMHQFYEPAIHAVYSTIVHGSAANPGPTAWTNYFPTTLGIGSLIGEYGIDFYANTYAKAKGIRLDTYASLVAGTGKRLGITEMGTSIGDAIPPDDATVTAYFNHLISILGINPPGSCMWYEDHIKNANNVISSPDDFRIPLLQQLADTVASGSSPGQISGTPTAAGLASFTARVTDNNSVTATAALTINITGAAPPVITTTTLPAATVGSPYSQAITVTGGAPPLTFAVTAGALPGGLALGAGSGLISGTPAADAATSGFTIAVADANGQADSQALFITVVTSVPPPTPAPQRPGWPQLIAEAGLQAAAPQVPAGTFILDDPVYGLLDTGILGDSTVWTDITAYARSTTITRPSTRVQGPLITYQGGTSSTPLKNGDGRFDPDNAASPYAGSIRPMVPFRWRAIYGSTEYHLFSGFTGTWSTPGANLGPNYSETTVTCDDGFKILAGVTLPAVPAGSDGVGDGDGEDSGARVTRILNAAAWYTDHRRIDTGDSIVQGTLYGDTALNLLQLTADSEIGSLYIDGAGNLTYRHRQAILTDTRSTQVQAIFGDLPGTTHGALTELPYLAVERADDDTQLANDVQATVAGGTLQEAENLTSQRTYLFPRTYARSDLILDDDPAALQWAQWVLSVSLSGDDRFDTLTVTPLRDPGLWPHVLGREIGDRIQVIRRPPGGVAAITQDVFIRGITHQVDASAGTWVTTWDLQSALRYTGFLILDDPATGLLNTGKLAF